MADLGVQQGELAQFIERVAAGEQRALDELYRRTSAKLFAVALRILGQRDLAEEAMQEAFVRIWKNAGRYDRGSGSPIAWAAAIVRNCAIDMRRRRGQRMADEAVELDDELVCPGATPASQAEQSDELRRLMACLDKLPKDRREMVLLAYYNGATREELGERFARPVATVKSVLRRSLESLRGCLDGQ